MALPLLPLAISLLAEVAPHLIKWLAGEKAGERAEQVIEVAKEVTGIADPENAIQVLKTDPNLILQFNQRMAEIDLEYYREDTERFREVHQTIRAELSSGDPFNRRWRATYGYCVAFSWALMFLTLFCAVIYSMVWDKTALAANVTAIKELLGASWELWGVALTILGYTIKKRTEDKHVAAGEHGAGILDKLVTAFKR